jgi:hypothetical protein
MKKVQITLELNEKSVKMIEKLEGVKEEGLTLKTLLEQEINHNPAEFIEMLGLDNW